jgi:hypothetical protein
MTDPRTDPQTSAERLAELLAVARNALTEDITPNVPAERRYTALMLGNALGIAAREVAAGDTPVREAVARLEALYNADARGTADEPRLLSLERRLAREIRQGAHDSAPTHEAVAAYLEARTRAQVAISNPRYLEAPA